MLDKYKIIMDGQGRGQIFRNGEQIKNVTAVQFNGAVNEINTITLTFTAGEVEIEAEAEEING